MASMKMTFSIIQKLPVFPRQAIIVLQHCLNPGCRISATYATSSSTPQAKEIRKLLESKFPLAKNIDVHDISGGCGGMYEVHVESVEFKGLTVVKQHRLVNDALKDEIKQMHGLRIQTSVPPANVK